MIILKSRQHVKKMPKEEALTTINMGHLAMTGSYKVGVL
jgi:hypothetical protein